MRMIESEIENEIWAYGRREIRMRREPMVGVRSIWDVTLMICVEPWLCLVLLLWNDGRYIWPQETSKFYKTILLHLSLFNTNLDKYFF